MKIILKAIARNNSTLVKNTTIMADISANFEILANLHIIHILIH